MNSQLFIFCIVHLLAVILSEPVHPAVIEGPQNEVPPSFSSSKLSSRIRSRVFRDATQGFNTPRLYRASGRFHKRVQSATTHDIQNVPLPSDSVQIVSYKYDAEKHDEKKIVNNELQSISEAEASDHARGIERTTMSIRGETPTTTVLPTTTLPVTTEMPEQNSILLPVPEKPRNLHFQTVQAGLQPQPPMVFTQAPPITVYPPPSLPDGTVIQQQQTHQPTNPLFPNPAAVAVVPAVPGVPNPAGETHEQLGCGWDWLTNSCKDVFNLNWCGKCHDFGNIFLHDCKCIAPLIQLPTTSRPTVVPPTVLPPAPQRQQVLPQQPQQQQQMYFWLI